MTLKKWWKKHSGKVARIGGLVAGAAVGTLAGNPLMGAMAGYGLADAVMDEVEGAKEAKEAKEALNDEKDLIQEQKDLVEAQAAQAWSNQQKENELSARERDNAVDSINEQSRASAISSFQQESAAEDALSDSGITEGSAYMAASASVYETQRRIDSWFSTQAGNIDIAGDRQAMDIGAAQLNQQSYQLQAKSLDLQTDRIDDKIDDISEAYSGWNTMLRLTGSSLSAITNAYSVSTSIGALNKAMEGSGGIGAFLKHPVKYGTQLKYDQMMGTNSFADGLSVPSYSPALGKNSVNSLSGMQKAYTLNPLSSLAFGG